MKLTDIKNGLPERAYRGADKRHSSSPEYEGGEPEVETKKMVIDFPITDPDSQKSIEIQLTAEVEVAITYNGDGRVDDAEITKVVIKSINDGKPMSFSAAKEKYGDDELDDDVIKDAITDKLWKVKNGRSIYVG